MKDGDLVLLKAPQIVIARKLKRGRVIEKSKKGRNRIQIFYKKPKLEIFYPFGTWDPSSPANHLLGS